MRKELTGLEALKEIKKIVLEYYNEFDFDNDKQPLDAEVEHLFSVVSQDLINYKTLKSREEE